MSFDEFIATLKAPAPPAEISPILAALWHDANGDWRRAHEIAQGAEGKSEFDRLHAYLHRKEGDESNARYWYRRSGGSIFAGTLQDEWADLARRQCAS